MLKFREKKFLTLVLFFSLTFATVVNCKELIETFTQAPAKKTDFPGFVSVQFNNHHICSGLMLDLDFVLTSASCLSAATKKNNLRRLSVIGGVVTLVSDTRGIMRNSKIALQHSKFNNETRENDIALLYSESFEDKKMGNTLTALKRPAIGDNCQVVSWKQINEVIFLIVNICTTKAQLTKILVSGNFNR